MARNRKKRGLKRFVKKFLPRSMFGRSLLILIVPVLLIQVISAAMFMNRHWDKMTDRLAYAVAGEIALIVQEVDGAAIETESFKRLATRAANNLDLVLNFEAEGQLSQQPEGAPSVVKATLNKALADKIRLPYRVVVDIDKKRVHAIIQIEEGLLHVHLPQKRLFSSSGYVFLLWMIGSSLALLAIAVLFMRNQIKPIRRLAVAADRFGKGRDLPASFKPEGAREVRQAAQAFIDMHKRIRRQIQQRTAMLAGVSHDLRTPLTRMKLQAAMLPENSDIQALRADIADMEKMIDAYLEFARGEGGEHTRITSFSEIIMPLAEKARRQNVTIDIALPDQEILLPLRPVAFSRALANIINNACKYADMIWVVGERTEKAVFIAIDDNGPGIEDHMYEEVFRPFVRGEPSRNKATGGVGLGLPIAQDIITAHGGRIWLAKSDKGGLRVNIEMPR